MILDLNTLLSNGQAITATAPSTNVIDLGPVGTVFGAAAPLVRDIGKGADTPMRVTVAETFNNLTSLQVSLQVSTDVAFTAPVTVFLSPVYTLAQLAVGARLLLPDSIPLNTNLRFMRLVYTVAGTAPTLGKITAGVTMGNQTNL